MTPAPHEPVKTLRSLVNIRKDSLRLVRCGISFKYLLTQILSDGSFRMLEYQFHIIQVHKHLKKYPFTCVTCIDIKMMVIQILRKERNPNLYMEWSSPLTPMPEWPSPSTASHMRNSLTEWQCKRIPKLFFLQTLSYITFAGLLICGQMISYILLCVVTFIVQL